MRWTMGWAKRGSDMSSDMRSCSVLTWILTCGSVSVVSPSSPRSELHMPTGKWAMWRGHRRVPVRITHNTHTTHTHITQTYNTHTYITHITHTHKRMFHPKHDSALRSTSRPHGWVWWERFLWPIIIITITILILSDAPDWRNIHSINLLLATSVSLFPLILANS